MELERILNCLIQTSSRDTSAEVKHRPSIRACCEGPLVTALHMEAAGSDWMTWKTFQCNSSEEDHRTAPDAVFSCLGNEQGKCPHKRLEAGQRKKRAF